MSRYSKAQTEYHKSRVRAVLVFSPDASLREISETLGASKKNPLHLDETYLSRLRTKIITERTRRHDTANIKARLSALQDKLKQIDAQLWQTAGSADTRARDKVAALKALAETELKLLQAEMDAGIFERKLGTVDIEARRSQPISAEHAEQVLKTFEAWGFVDTTAREILPETKHLNAPDAQPTNQTAAGPDPGQH